jgi:hypothetical protein
VAVRAIRAEAQGICSRSPVVLRRQAEYGKSKLQLRCESPVFSRQSSVNRKVTAPSDGIRHRSLLSDVQMASKRGRFSVECIDFLMSARTAIEHGHGRVLKWW